IVTRRGAGTTIAPGAAAEARRLAEAAQREAGGPVDAGLAALFAGPIAAARARGARDVEILASVRAALARESGGGPARPRGRHRPRRDAPPRAPRPRARRGDPLGAGRAARRGDRGAAMDPREPRCLPRPRGTLAGRWADPGVRGG